MGVYYLERRTEEGEMERWDKGGNEGTDGGDEGEMKGRQMRFESKWRNMRELQGEVRGYST